MCMELITDLDPEAQELNFCVGLAREGESVSLIK